MDFSQWAKIDGKFVPTTETATRLDPGAYDISVTNSGQLIFDPVDMRDETLIKFEDSATDDVVSEIQTFWGKGDQFHRYGMPHKRGILLYGPPGSGKSSTVQLISREVVSRGGVVLLYGHPDVFAGAYRVLRQIQPDTPLVVVMEDLDAILKGNPESKVLNLLDGIEAVDRIVFLATTNYPERLTPRIYNRPSRFDRRVMISHPLDGSRETYIKSLLLPEDLEKIDMKRWVRDTDGFSLAHIKELFVSVLIIGTKYDSALKRLKSMISEKPSSVYDDLQEGQTLPDSGQYV